jgi:hypothetical protein
MGGPVGIAWGDSSGKIQAHRLVLELFSLGGTSPELIGPGAFFLRRFWPAFMLPSFLKSSFWRFPSEYNLSNKRHSTTALQKHAYSGAKFAMG